MYADKPMIIITGPTASGKSALAVALAKEINGEIISADSMQVYRRMNIGTAKITPEEMQGIPHHLIDILEPTEEFHVFLFQKLAKQALDRIYAAGKIPIIAGGTGFYIQALLYDIGFEEAADFDYRAELEQYAKDCGNHALHERLREIDPVSYRTIHENNVKRTVRALEFYRTNGYPISEHNEAQRQRQSPYRFAYFVLHENRDALYQRIERRVDQMITDGLTDEVAKLLSDGCTEDMTSMQGLGYKEMIPYLHGEISLQDAVYTLKRDTRHFAKRQLTSFRRERDVIFLDKELYPSVKQQLAYIQAILEEIHI